MSRKGIVMTMLVALFALSGCKEEPKAKIDGSAFLYMNVKDKGMRIAESDAPKEGVEGVDYPFSPRTIVEKSQNLWLKDADGDVVLKGIADEQKDLENARIKWWGYDIILPNGELNPYLMTSENVTICSGENEDDIKNVMAYIPNAVMKKAWADIQSAYNAGNYDEVYRIFHETYTAIPITPKEYAKLKEEGKN